MCCDLALACVCALQKASCPDISSASTYVDPALAACSGTSEIYTPKARGAPGKQSFFLMRFSQIMLQTTVCSMNTETIG